MELYILLQQFRKIVRAKISIHQGVFRNRGIVPSSIELEIITVYAYCCYYQLFWKRSV